MPATAPPASDQIVLPLLTWHQTARRDLPWRRDRSPYAVWIAEVMLQQTQTATVIPYYEQWMRRFPDLAALAAASLDDVLRAWAGLGYYARPRQLYRAAQLIVARHAGQIPAARRELLALPGIGRYTAGAILSLAFGQREPVLDGNVRRVLCRLYDIAADPQIVSLGSAAFHQSLNISRRHTAFYKDGFNLTPNQQIYQLINPAQSRFVLSAKALK